MKQSNAAHGKAIKNQEEQPRLPRTQNDPEAITPAPVILTFRLDGHTFGLPVCDVVQIIEMLTITPLPQLPAAIRGIINIHGRGVPVMDMRHRLGLPTRPYGMHTPIILADLEGQLIGLVVDEVDAVLDDVSIAPENTQFNPTVQPLSNASLSSPSSLFTQLGIADGKLIPLLGLKALFSQEEQKQLEEAIPQQTLSGALL